jgi:hypothetical protein
MDDLQHARRLSPFDTLSFKVQAAIAYAHFFVGRYDEASMAAEAACGRNHTISLRCAARQPVTPSPDDQRERARYSRRCVRSIPTFGSEILAIS